MVKKSMKQAAAAGTAVFDILAAGNVQRVSDVKDVSNVSDVKDAAEITDVTNNHDVNSAENAQKVQYVYNVLDVQNVLYNDPNRKAGRPRKYGSDLVRTTLKIPADIKEYLTIAAAKASIAQRREVSFTEYLCSLVAADRELHKDD